MRHLREFTLFALVVVFYWLSAYLAALALAPTLAINAAFAVAVIATLFAFGLIATKQDEGPLIALWALGPVILMAAAIGFWISRLLGRALGVN